MDVHVGCHYSYKRIAANMLDWVSTTFGIWRTNTGMEGMQLLRVPLSKKPCRKRGIRSNASLGKSKNKRKEKYKCSARVHVGADKVPNK
jgi:hypothetical protein